MDNDAVVCAAEVKHSLADPFRFFELHAWTYEPRPHILKAMGMPSSRLPFVLYPFQKDAIGQIVDHIAKGKDLLILKSRTMGVTWFIDIIYLWFWLQNEGGSNFLVGSEKQDKVDKKGEISTIMEKIRYCFYRLHPAFAPDGFDINRHDKYLLFTNPVNGNSIQGESNNSEFSRSGRYKSEFLDEFAFWENTAEAAWMATADSTPCRIVVSTPNGIGGTFSSILHSGSIDIVTLHWSEHPIYGAGKWKGVHPFKPELTDVWLSDWYLGECERRKDNPNAVYQELDIDFLSTGSPYFNNLLLNRRYKTLADAEIKGKRYSFERIGEDVRLIESANGSVWILKSCDHIKKWVDYRYCISADVAEGLEKGDYDCAYVHDRVTGEDVAWVHGRMDTDVFAILLVHLAKMYDKAYVAIENNNHGHAVLKKVVGLGYLRIMYEKDFTVTPSLDKVKIGWNTNAITRPVMCSDLREIVNAEKDGIKDKEFFNEAMTFVYSKNGKPEADAGCYDDRVMAQAIKFQLHMWLPSPKKAEVKPFPKDYEGKKGKKEKVVEGARFV